MKAKAPNAITDDKNQELLEKIREERFLKPVILVNVRWWDGYLEAFECSQVRQGAYLLWMRLVNGQNRNIPLFQVRWFSTDPESHAFKKGDPNISK